MATWIRVLASYFTGSGGGACGTLQDGKFHYAELGTATLGGVATGYGRLADKLGKGGELPCGFGLWIRYKGKATYATKGDRGYGDPTKGIHDSGQRDIDLFDHLAYYLGMTGVDYVEVTDGKTVSTPPPIIPQQHEPDAKDYDWSPLLDDASTQMQVHGNRAFQHAREIELIVGSCKYVTEDGPR